MAFVGRLNRSHADYADCEVFHDSRSKLQKNYTVSSCEMNEEDEEEELKQKQCQGNYSRTFIKTFDMECPDLLSSPSTVRYVGDSASFGELNSMADTEMSTLRFISPRSLETETESGTLCQSHLTVLGNSYSSDYSSASDDKGYPIVQVIAPVEMEVETSQKERGSTTSMCSWEQEEEIYEETQPTNTEPEYQNVPLLELGSDTASLYYEQQSQLEQLKLIRQAEAYDNWLSAKKRQCQYKQRAARELREQEQQKAAQRQQLNEQRVREWCKRKDRQCRQLSQPRQPHGKPQVQLDEVALCRLQAWEMKKIKEAERRREREQLQALRAQRLEQQRKEAANQAWQHWIKGVEQRPKPVPLNQGLKTLSGTVSDIYINPNHWVHLNEKN